MSLLPVVTRLRAACARKGTRHVVDFPRRAACDHSLLWRCLRRRRDDGPRGEVNYWRWAYRRSNDWQASTENAADILIVWSSRSCGRAVVVGMGLRWRRRYTRQPRRTNCTHPTGRHQYQSVCHTKILLQLLLLLTTYCNLLVIIYYYYLISYLLF